MRLSLNSCCDAIRSALPQPMQSHCVVSNAVTAVFGTFFSTPKLRQMANNKGSVPELGCFDFLP